MALCALWTGAVSSPSSKSISSLAERMPSHVPTYAVPVPQVREYLFLHVHLQTRIPDRRYHCPRREGLPIAGFRFVPSLGATNFKPTVSHLEAKCHCHRHRRSVHHRQNADFCQESSGTRRLPLHPNSFCNSLRERETVHF